VHNLFSYGSLRDEEVQRAVFGRTVDTTADAIVGYRMVTLTITDPKAIAISGRSDHRIIEPTGHDDDQVEGAVLPISEDELKRADTYEDAAYKRVSVRLRSGADAWVYVRA
jgi:gamma-glutamylcyclotransferase (GGCT)/AIG2-like uncharacterized protein YtfP